MLGLLGRLLPWVLIFAVWLGLNKALDKIDAEKAKAQAHPFWQKLFWIWGWTLGIRSKFVVVRYVTSGIVLFFVMRWIALSLSTPLP